MATIVHALETLQKWVDENLCEGSEFKVPPSGDKPDGHLYKYETTKPSAFILYIPVPEKNKAKAPPAPAEVPSICIQLIKCTDRKNTRELDIRLALATWNPGLHKPKEFIRNSEGWRDVWNFTDKCLRVIENAEYLSGLRVKIENGIEFGPIDEQDASASLYPYWFSYIAFTIECGNVPIKSYDNLM
jgi:hypothetical protein